MAPWVNRIANGRFAWEGREVSVAGGPGGDRQGLHGISWRMPWSVLQQGETEAKLGLVWNGAAGWPFSFSLTRRFVLAEDELAIDSILHNTGAGPMPAALGFHPFFPSAGARLRAKTSAAWTTDAAGLPVSLAFEDVADRMSRGLAVETQPLDHCFVGWDGVAIVDWPTHSMTMRTEPALRYLQVYSPANAGYFCAEPQSAMPDAFNRHPDISGARSLAPGAEMGVRLRLKISRAIRGAGA